MEKIKEKYITYRQQRKRYQVTIRIRKKTVTRQADTLEEAIRIRDKILGVKRKEVKKFSFRDKFEEWYKTKCETISLTTKLRYDDLIKKAIMPIFSKMDISQINRELIQNIINDLVKNGYPLKNSSNTISPYSIKKILTLLRQFFYYVYLDPNPCIKIYYPKNKRKRREYISDEEKESILAYIQNKRGRGFAFLLKMYFETGCRRGELLGLTWRYVDLENNTIQIQKTIIEGESNRALLKLTPKNIHSERLIPISREVVDKLKFYLIFAKKKNPKGYLDALVFPKDASGSPLLPETITGYFRKARKALGIKKNISLHSTRHTFASKLINSGVPIPVVQELGGWGEATTLMNVYTHSLKGESKKAMQRVIFDNK